MLMNRNMNEYRNDIIPFSIISLVCSRVGTPVASLYSYLKASDLENTTS